MILMEKFLCCFLAAALLLPAVSGQSAAIAQHEVPVPRVSSLCTDSESEPPVEEPPVEEPPVEEPPVEEPPVEEPPVELTPEEQINRICDRLAGEHPEAAGILLVAFYRAGGRLTSCVQGILDEPNRIALPEKWAVCKIFLLAGNYAPLAMEEVENPAGDEEPAEPETPPEEEPPVKEEVLMEGDLIRIGIYYGTAGKTTQNLSLTTGSGYYFGYYDPEQNNRFVILDSTTVAKLTVSTDGETMVVTGTDDGAELFRHSPENGTRLGILPYSDSGEKTVARCGYNYYGGFRFEPMAAYDGTMTIVNIVPLEDYLKGVVPYEMSASWHGEALKVQAICARTFALANRNGKHEKRFGFDLCDANCCQVYKGYYSNKNEAYVSNVYGAVDSTAGTVLMYGGSYCSTVYYSSNGGASESAKNVWGTDHSYLQGVFDPYEAHVADRISKYHWTVTYTGAELQEKLVAKGYVKCGLIKEVRTTLSETGNVITLTFVDEKDDSYSFYRSNCRTLLSLRSIRYSVTAGAEGEVADPAFVDEIDTMDFSLYQSLITENGSIPYLDTGFALETPGAVGMSTASPASADGEEPILFVFSGSGWGHNVGMSQYGSLAMAELGFTHEEILQFYYQGATLVQN